MTLDKICENIAEEFECVAENELSSQIAENVRLFADLWIKLSEDQKAEWMQRLIDIVRKDKCLSAIYVYSFATFHIHNKKWMEELLEIVLSATWMGANPLYFLYWQIFRRFMLWPDCETENAKVMHWGLFQRICKTYADDIGDLKWIEEAERDRNLVVVITSQFVNPTMHGPSKTTLDRCKSIIQVMQKEVLLINTAEVLSAVGELPFVGQNISSYDEEMCNWEYINWKNVSIPFFQCDNNMPNKEVLNILVENIVEMKPLFVIEIGTGSILANLVSKCLPVLSVVTGFSRLSITETQYQTSALVMTDKERQMLEQVGKDESHVIPGLFTFGLREQQQKFTREQLGLPDGQFLLVVIGTRLEQEIDDAFMKMLSAVNNREIGIVYIGEFERFEYFSKKYPEMAKHMYSLGDQSDVLAVLELCDLFVNPIRLGGGTSAAEALSKGLPAVSTPYGDVGATVGKEFWVKDYAEMAEVINRYQNDAEFYAQQSEMAKKRAERLLDTDGEFVKVIKEFGNRMGEYYIPF